VTALVLPAFGWRAVFFVGILPALFTLWIRRAVREPEAWRASRAAAAPPATLGAVFADGRARVTVLLTLMNACCMFAWWGYYLWIPAYLSLPLTEGGIGLSTTHMAWLVGVMQVSTWFGYVTFGY